jgi:hypothetical protein
MFNLTLVNLSTEDLSPGAGFGSNAAGEIDQDQLIALLELFRTIESMQVLEADPHLIVESRNGKYLIRTGQGKLFLYDARDSAKPYAELTAAEIARLLSAAPVAPQEEAAPLPAAPARTPHRGIAIAMLAAGLCLNGYTLYSVFYIDDVNQKPAIVLITDPAELATRQNTVVGRYSTGGEAGDRFIVVGRDGGVNFGKVGGKSQRLESNDTYRIGRHEDQLCLTTPDSGVIDVTGPNTLVYYRDIYRRMK